MLNASLNKKALARQYRLDDRVRIDNVLKKDVAEQIRQICLEHVPFETVCAPDNRFKIFSAQEMAAMKEDARQQLQAKLYEEAQRGTGFFYNAYMMRRAQQHLDKEALAPLHELFALLNSPEMLQLARDVTGRKDIQRADAQFTRFTAGHYLTRQRDVVAGQQRRVVYLLSFTREWHPDWGGLLQFYEDDGTPRDAWAPQFNSLTLFDVRHVHALTYVAPFANQPLLSLSGRFRAEPLP